MIDPTHYANQRTVIHVPILVGQTLSAPISLHGLTFCGVMTPDNLTGTTLTLRMSDTLAGDYVPVENGSGSLYTMNVTANRFVPVTNLAISAGLSYIRLVSSAAQTGSLATVKVVVRPV